MLRVELSRVKRAAEGTELLHKVYGERNWAGTGFVRPPADPAPEARVRSVDPLIAPAQPTLY